MAELSEQMENVKTTEIADTPLNGELPIPDVKGTDFSKALAGKGRTNDQLAEDDDEIVEAPAPKVAKVKADGTEEEEKPIVKPWARARILEKERDSKDSEIGELKNRIEMLGNALERLVAQGAQPQTAETAPEDAEIDRELDPVGAILQEIKTLKRDVDAMRTGTVQQQNANIIEQALGAVNNDLIQQTQTDPVFVEAVGHIAKVMERSIAKKYPNATEAQRLKLAEDSVNMTKLDWARANKNPVEEMYDMAMTLGFDPDATEARLAAQGKVATTPAAPKKATPTAKSDPKESIAKAREKASAVAGLGGVEGAPARRFTGKELASAKNEDEFTFRLNELIKSGQVRPNNSRPGKTPDFSELLPGKGVRV